MKMVLTEAPDDDVAEMYREVEPGKWTLIIDDHPDYQAAQAQDGTKTTERQARTDAAFDPIGA